MSEPAHTISLMYATESRRIGKTWRPASSTSTMVPTTQSPVWDSPTAPDRGRLSIVRRSPLLGMATLSVCAAALIVAPGAMGAKRGPGKVITKTATVTVAPGASASATARCPRGTNVLGGGFTSLPFGIGAGSQPLGPVPFESHRTGKRSWTASAALFPMATQSGSLTAYAYCRRGAARLAQRTATAQTPASMLGVPGTATAICPARKKAVAGGLLTTIQIAMNTGAIPISSLRSSARNWTIGATGVGPPQRVTAYAYCAQKGRGRRSASTSIPGNTVRSLDTPKCKRPKKSLSGGFAVNKPIFGPIITANITEIFESRRIGRRWRNTGVHAGTNTSGSLTGYGYCG